MMNYCVHTFDGRISVTVTVVSVEKSGGTSMIARRGSTVFLMPSLTLLKEMESRFEIRIQNEQYITMQAPSK